MIQRPQSVYLLLTAIISGLLFYIPLFEAITQGEAKSITILSNSFLLVLNSTIGIIAFLAIFLFKWRQLQMRACRLNLLLIFLLIALLFFASDTFSSGLEQKVAYKFGTYLPLVQVLLIMLANWGIRRDEKLVKSADRLR